MAENSNYEHHNAPKFQNSTIKIVAITAILYFIIAKLSLFIFVTEINILPFFPAMGFAIVAMLLWGRKAIYGVAIGCLLFSINLYQSDFQNATTFDELMKPLSLCFIRPIIASLNVFLVSYFSQLWCKKKYPFNSDKNVLFFSFASLLGTFISVSIGFIPLALTPYFSLENCILIWSNMVRGNVLGIILFTPFMFSWLYDTNEITKWSTIKKIEAFVLLILTLSITIYIFETHANNESILFFLMIWAACRFGMKVITTVALIIAIIAIYCTGHNMGGFIFSGWNNDFFMLQLFLLVNMVSSLFLKAILEEKENKESKLIISEHDLGLEKNILKATIESPKEVSIFSLDTNLNYLSFNSGHANYMKKAHGAKIKIGDNHAELLSNVELKKETTETLLHVLKGNDSLEEIKNELDEYLNIARSPIKNNENEIIGIITIINDITELKLKEIQLEKNNFFLNERVKELRCVFDISKIISNKRLSKSKKMEACVQTIPKAFQFPEIANCRIQFLENQFISNNYQESNYFLKQKININGEEWGSIEVNYFDTRKLEKENLFLDEEVKLLETLADIISKSIETKLAEEKLLKSEENYRTIFENVQDVFFKTSIETGEILDISPSCSSFNGITREELIGQDRSIIYSDKDKMDLMFQKIVTEQKVTDYINEIAINEKLYHVSINAKIILDSNGEPKYAVGSIRDITERRLAEENLKISEEKFRAIYESFDDIYFKKTIDGTLLDVSPSIEKHFDMKRELVIGQNAYDFYADRAEGERFYESVLQNKQVNDYEERFVTGSGEIIYFSVNAKVIYDSNGEPAYFEGTMRNVNERILNQKRILEVTEKIKESEEKYRSIFENMQDVYYMHTLDGKIFEVTPSVEKHFKYTREEMIGKYTGDLYYDPLKQQELKEKIIRDGYLSDEHVQFVTATGEPMYFSLTNKIIFDKEGKPSHIEGSMRNINERIINQNKLLEATEKIKESEEEFRAIFNSFEDMYYRISLDGIIQNVNPSIEKILKFKREDIIGTKISDLYLNPQDRTKIIQIIKEEGYINDCETIFRDKDNNPIFVSINAHLAYDSLGNPLCTEGTIRDISERKKNELEIENANQIIKESEQKYRTIFDSVRDVFFRASAKSHKILDISPSCTYFDMKPEDIIGKSITEFYHNPEDRIPVLKELMQNGEIKNYDVKFSLNSKEYTVSINSKIAYNENKEPEFLIGSFRDVSDRVRAEENLKISEAKFRSIFENFEDVYFRTTVDGTILDVSPSFEKHFLKPCSHALENSVFDFYYDKQDREFIIEKLKTEGKISDLDILFRDGNGNIVFFSVNARLIYDENGAPVYIEKSMRNVNDRVAFQKEILEKNRKLEFQNTELEQFAYIASHDLQEPLITVIQCAQLLQEGLYDNLDEEKKQYLEFINSSTSRMQLLVKGLLDYSRIGKERKNCQIDCNEIVANVLADMDVSLKESNAIVEYENLPIIEGYSTEIRQLFQNVISNANKYRKKGQQPKIKIAAVKEENNWTFSIEDNGIGIKKQDMDKVFVIFKRLHNRDEYQGTGIGLSHCKKIVEHHNGAIWVESEYNEGSTFKWTFPIELN